MTVHFRFPANSSDLKGSRTIRIVKKLFVREVSANALTLKMTAKANKDFTGLDRAYRKKLVSIFAEIQLRTYSNLLADVFRYAQPVSIDKWGAYHLLDCDIDGIVLTFLGNPIDQTLLISSIEINGDEDGPSDGTSIIIQPASQDFHEIADIILDEIKRPFSYQPLNRAQYFGRYRKVLISRFSEIITVCLIAGYGFEQKESSGNHAPSRNLLKKDHTKHYHF